MTTYTTVKEETAWAIMVDGEKQPGSFPSEAAALKMTRKLAKPGDHLTKVCSDCGDWRYHRHSAFGYKMEH